jgi:hypothetical protein
MQKAQLGPYDDSASYAPELAVKFRVDKNEPVEIPVKPINLAGSLVLGATNAYEPHLDDRMYTLGCFGIRKSEWPRLKQDLAK